MLPFKVLKIFIGLSCSLPLSVWFGGLGAGRYSSYSLFHWRGGDEMQLSKGEIEIHSVPSDIVFIAFPSKHEAATQSGESAYADHADKFFMSTFHRKADKKGDGESGY